MSRQDVYPTPTSKARTLDTVADIAHNAVDQGVPPEQVAAALREAADEIDAEYAEVPDVW